MIFRSISSVLASVFPLVCDHVTLRTRTVSLSWRPRRDSLLDRLFQQYSESNHLCILQQVGKTFVAQIFVWASRKNWFRGKFQSKSSPTIKQNMKIHQKLKSFSWTPLCFCIQTIFPQKLSEIESWKKNL